MQIILTEISKILTNQQINAGNEITAIVFITTQGGGFNDNSL
jgi:hypothetical protein